MALYPAASQRPIGPQYIPDTPMAAHNRVNLHTQAGLGSLFGFFSAPGRASAHFWVAKTGLVEQYQDTAHRAEADLEGNDATVSIETEGSLEPWTDAQLAAIIALVAWICDTHGIPKVLASSSKIGDSSRGISWHRLGIDGNFPALPSRYAGRLQRGGGMHYSNATGKACPGEARIDQIHDAVLPGVTGGVVPVPNPLPPTPTPPPVTSGLDADGMWGNATTTRAQEVLGTTADGEVWYQYQPNAQPAWTSGWKYNYSKGKGSPLIAAMQRGLGINDDGVAGPEFVRAFQGRMGTVVDGQLWANSPAVKEFQRRLNAGTW